MDCLSFEWHDEKAMKNIIKHGISFLEASSVFSDSLSITSQDEHHSYDEERWVIIGHSNKARLLTVSFTERNRNIRIISARKSTRKEKQIYEKTN